MEGTAPAAHGQSHLEGKQSLQACVIASYGLAVCFTQILLADSTICTMTNKLHTVSTERSYRKFGHPLARVVCSASAAGNWPEVCHDRVLCPEAMLVTELNVANHNDACA